MSDKERTLRAQMAATILAGLLADPTSGELTDKDVLLIACDYVDMILNELEARDLNSDE